MQGCGPCLGETPVGVGGSEERAFCAVRVTEPEEAPDASIAQAISDLIPAVPRGRGRRAHRRRSGGPGCARASCCGLTGPQQPGAGPLLSAERTQRRVCWVRCLCATVRICVCVCVCLRSECVCVSVCEMPLAGASGDSRAGHSSSLQARGHSPSVVPPAVHSANSPGRPQEPGRLGPDPTCPQFRAALPIWEAVARCSY